MGGKWFSARWHVYIDMNGTRGGGLGDGDAENSQDSPDSAFFNISLADACRDVGLRAKASASCERRRKAHGAIPNFEFLSSQDCPIRVRARVRRVTSM